MLQKLSLQAKAVPARIGLALAILALICLTACAAKKEVRHLTSDVCLVIPQQTTKQEVLSFLGTPDLRQSQKDQTEKWTYYDVKKSFFGKKDYDVVIVTFRKDIATACFYREMLEEQFEDTVSPKDGSLVD